MEDTQAGHNSNMYPIADENISIYSTTSNSGKCRVIEELEDQLINEQILSVSLQQKSKELEKQICLKLNTSSIQNELNEEKHNHSLTAENLKTKIMNLGKLIDSTKTENKSLKERIQNFESGEEILQAKNQMLFDMNQVARKFDRKLAEKQLELDNI